MKKYFEPTERNVKRGAAALALAALALLLAWVFSDIPSHGQVPNPGNAIGNVQNPSAGLTAVSVGTTNGNTALSWAIVPARSANAGTPVITYLNASSDLSFAAITNYTITATTVANFTNSTVSLPTTGTNGFAVNDYVIIRHALTENYEKRVVDTPTSATNVTVTVAPLEAVLPGDVLYRCQAKGSAYIPFSAAGTNISLTAAGLPIFAGQKGCPMLIEVNATTKGAINALTAIWLP